MVKLKCVDNFVGVFMLLRSEKESNENLLIKTSHLIVSVINRDRK